MAAAKNTQKKKKKSTKTQEGNVRKGFKWLKLNFHNSEEVADPKKIEHRDNIHFVCGLVMAVLSIAVFLALISHLFTGVEDQKLINDESYTATNWLGLYGYRTAYWMMDNTFGVFAILIPVFMLAASVRVMGIVKVRLHKWFLNCMIVMIWGSAFAAYIVKTIGWGANSYIDWGGMIGRQEVDLISQKVNSVGTLLVLGVTALLYLFYVSDESITFIRHLMIPKRKPTQEEEEETEEDQTTPMTEDEKDEQLPNEEQTAVEVQLSTEPSDKPFQDNPEDTATTIDFANDNNFEIPLKKGEQALPLEIEPTQEDMKVVMGKEPEKADVDEKDALEPYDPKLDLEFYKYPTLNLLKKYENTSSGIDMEEQQENKDRILRVLKNFSVEIASIKATIGPTVTLYEIVPAAGVKINKIRNLEDDIALSLSALGIRIIAPIPGKGTIGIEVPNKNPQIVSMESIINSRKFQETDYELPMALGKTITNEVFMADLAKMPHLLVAGATGQGKSVGLNAILTSLLYKKHPAELKLVMVDPKKVEFSVYNPIVNHFLAQVEGTEDTEEPIITDVDKVKATLKSLCVEMDTRYDLLKRARARNVKEYNQKFKDRQLNPENGHKFMPYIVVIIDEFGDLIMTAGKEIELPIARIAQLARAVGIHMIIATQRPTTNIITGTIKANFPALIAFKVASVVDSRTILDRTGANQLVGKGDMLFLSGSEPVRVQCAFVDTPEVEKITRFVACQQSYNAPFPLPEVPMENSEGGDAANVDMKHLDPMFEEVARMVVLEQCGSTSMVQRKFSIGYNRAGRLMDQLEKAGIVGPGKGSKPRDVLCISEEDLQLRIDNLR